MKYLCLTNNKLEEIPEPSPNVYQTKLQELYLSANHLGDNIVPVVSGFLKLRVLHLAYNQITEIHDRYRLIMHAYHVLVQPNVRR